MKPFLLFCGDNYYPCGGWDDLVGEFDSAAEAFAEGRKLALKGGRLVWFHIVNLQLGRKLELQEAQVVASDGVKVADGAA